MNICPVVSQRCCFPGVIHCFCLLQSFYLLFHINFFSTESEGLIETPNLGLSFPKPFFPYCPVVGAHVNYRILQETSLKRVEICSIYQYVISNHFIAIYL